MKQSLNFEWHFQEGYDEASLLKPLKEYEEIDIPHACKEVPYNDFSEDDYQGLFTYEKTFDAELEDGHHYFLDFEGFMLQADIYLNGTLLGHYVSGWIPVVIEVSELLKKKNNRLLVVLDSREDKKIPPFGKAVDYLTFSGIYRPVYLIDKPAEYIERVAVINADDKGLELRTTVVGDRKPVHELFDRDNKLVRSFKEDKVDLDNLHLWSIDDPYLYTLKTTLGEGDEADVVMTRIGFRTFELRNGLLYLNGRKTKLMGLNRHQNYPYVGPSLPKSAQEEDADIIKYELGCNIVRTSHYPQSEDFLNRCDEIGLLVQTEVTGWQYIGKDKEWRDNFYRFTKGMVEKEQNHPSLMAYGIRVDESPDDDELYGNAYRICKELDPHRLTTGVRNFKDSSFFEDFYSYNDFSCSNLTHGLDEPKTVKGAKGRPVLDSENNGHMFPTKMYDPVAKRVEHALRHLRVLNDSIQMDWMGEIGWCAFDYNTHRDFGSGDHICYHGVCDNYRNRKSAGFALLSQTAKDPMMHVANIPLSGDNDEANIKPLYVFTNVDYIKFYKNGRYVNTFYPDKKDYPSLPHAPIFIDDYIGELFDEGITGKDRDVIVKGLNYIANVGYLHVDKTKLLNCARVLLKHHISQSMMTEWYWKYESSWGEVVNTYELKGFIGDKEVISETFAPSTRFHYAVTPRATELVNGDTYDVTRVQVLFLDQNDHQQYYSFRPLSFETDGPIEVVGPKMISMMGGSGAVYVRSRSVNKPAKATLTIHTDLGDKEVEFLVR